MNFLCSWIDSRGKLIVILLLACILTFACDNAFAWGSVRENKAIGLGVMIAPSHDYILKEAYSNLEKDPAYNKDAFPSLGSTDALEKTQILYYEGQNVDVWGKISGNGPDSPTANTSYSWHEYNPDIKAGNAPQQAAEWFEKLEKHIEDRELESAAKDAAFLAHYITDVTCPFHTNGRPREEDDSKRYAEKMILPLPLEITGYPLSITKIGMGRNQTPQYNEALIRDYPIGQRVRGTGGNGNKDWFREYSNWQGLSDNNKLNDWFDPWYCDGTVGTLIEASSTHALWEWYAYNNYSKPLDTKVGYAEEFLKIQKNKRNGDPSNIAEFAKEIASKTRENQKTILDESTTKDTHRDINSELGKAYREAISDVYTVWRASFSALRPDIEVVETGKQQPKKLRVKIKNNAAKTEDEGNSTATDIEIDVALLESTGCIHLSNNNNGYPKKINPGEEIVIDDVWELTSTRDCSEEAKFQVSVKGKFEGIPDSGRSVINKTLSIEMDKKKKDKSPEPLQLSFAIENAVMEEAIPQPGHGFDDIVWSQNGVLAGPKLIITGEAKGAQNVSVRIEGSDSDWDLAGGPFQVIATIPDYIIEEKGYAYYRIRAISASGRMIEYYGNLRMKGG